MQCQPLCVSALHPTLPAWRGLPHCSGVIRVAAPLGCTTLLPSACLQAAFLIPISVGIHTALGFGCCTPGLPFSTPLSICLQAAFLIPVSVCIYTATGGLKATFLSSYIHTVIIYVALCIFAFTVYATGPDLGSPKKVRGAPVPFLSGAPPLTAAPRAVSAGCVSGPQAACLQSVWPSGAGHPVALQAAVSTRGLHTDCLAVVAVLSHPGVQVKIFCRPCMASSSL